MAKKKKNFNAAVEEKEDKLTLDDCEEMFFADTAAFLEEIHFINGRKVQDEDPALYVEMKSGELIDLRKKLNDKLCAYFFDITQQYVDSSFPYSIVKHCKIRALSKTCGQKVVLVKRSLRIGNNVFINPVSGNGKLYRINQNGITLANFAKIKASNDPLMVPLTDVDLETPATEFIPLLKKIFRMNDDVIRLIAIWLVCTILDLPTPILVATGVQGSGKTVFASSLRYLYNATFEKSNVCMMPSKVDDVAVLLGSSRMVVMDNATVINDPEILDLLCLSFSGGNYKKRKLFSDMDVSSINVFCAAVFSAIEFPFKRNDLLSRSLEIKTKPFADGERISPEKIRERIDKLHGKLYGAVMNAIHQYFEGHEAYLEKTDIAVPSDVRITDFYELGCEILPILDPNLTAADFDAALRYNQNQSKIELAMEETVVHAISNLLDKSDGHIEIAAEKLLKKIITEAAASNLGNKIPGSPSVLSTYLKNNGDLFSAVGIAVKKRYSHDDKLWEFSKNSAGNSVNSPQTNASAPAPSSPVYPDEGIEEAELDEL